MMRDKTVKTFIVLLKLIFAQNVQVLLCWNFCPFELLSCLSYEWARNDETDELNGGIK